MSIYFRNVLKAIGSEDALEAYNNLSEKESMVQAAETKILAKDQQIEVKRTDLARMAHVVDNFNEREEARKKKEALQALVDITKLKRATAERMEAHVRLS